MNVFLDTDICIAILRGKEPELAARLKRFPISSVKLPSIVVGELYVGAEKSMDPINARKKLSIFLRDLPTAAFDENEAKRYGQVRAHLEKKGTSIGANDFIIAATVLDQNGLLVTRNKREYERVPGLNIEVW